MKTFMPFVMMFMMLFAACEYNDENKKCTEAYVLRLAGCRMLSGEEKSDCFFDAAAILYACDPESYWKSWGCDDGQPCM